MLICDDVVFFLFDTDVPGPPSNICLHVTSNRSLTVTFAEPEEKNGAMVTRYKSKPPLIVER